ncbi:ABC transporter ATP-binding protein [Fictibacillus phosphorivorans]|uniref:ABC transporter ATP-binding protein n=1 Tax=Fictibacillus phosphorivorans TaxID=1221500 RepID=UPI00203DE189|nr:ABC transporter ATP-binding protein [Fictibacillus phosphorivorans]MCM3718045.1 ABC transporter ATP-binding protein [Fictibacillus phosphorivorans]MCM3775672.1 ABC transporter ATP-binding protein [Fictibacillus phosphorivorans]
MIFMDDHGKTVTTLKGKEADKIIKRIEQASTDHEVQLILAKVTGNFKRGNEKDISKKMDGKGE